MRAKIRQWLTIVVGFVRDRPLGAAGAFVILLMIIAAISANVLAPYDPLENDYGAMFQAPGGQHWLGTDSFGRDVLSRILYGSRTALWVGFCSSLCGTTIGALVGITCAYFGGKTDLFAQRFMDILLSFPLIVLALVVVAVLGSGIWNVILAISIPMIPRAALVVRSSALALRQMAFIEAALTLGSSHWRVIFWHMAPNVMAPYLIMLTAFLGQAILLEASLSFLGLGVQAPYASWGSLAADGVQHIAVFPWLLIGPGLTMALTLFSMNFIGDGVRDALDPQMRKS